MKIMDKHNEETKVEEKIKCIRSKQNAHTGVNKKCEGVKYKNYGGKKGNRAKEEN